MLAPPESGQATWTEAVLHSFNYLRNGCGTMAVGAFSPRAAGFSGRRSRYLAGYRWWTSVGRVQHSIPASLEDNPAEAA